MTLQRKIPEHEAIYRRIRDAILFGELIPGQSVTIQGLTEMTGTGMTPVREAIRRLTSDGALQAMDNRRIVVPELNPALLDELAFARLSIEPHLAELALKTNPSSLAKELAEIDRELNQSIETGSVEGYLFHNHRFHFALYERSGAEILCSIARSLWLRSGPSLRVVCGRFGTANLPDMHDSAIAAIESNNCAMLRRAIAEDITQGLDQIRAAMADDGAVEGD